MFGGRGLSTMIGGHANATTRRDTPIPSRRRRPEKGNATHEGRRAFIPSYGDFGTPTHIDDQGREYRRSSRSKTELFARIPIRRRTAAERAEHTTIGGNAHSEDRVRRSSRSGGPWNPRWPQIGDWINLRDLRTYSVESVVVVALFSMPNSATAHLVVKE